jgi:hypothetical protein
MEPTLDTRDQLEWELRDEELDRMGGDGRLALCSGAWVCATGLGSKIDA